ncbi:MAG: aminopeptidase P family protein [Lachnospiraceae bacterium]|nr:aminopeptidase P family protein [Lachnospiraceae bacterium]MDD7378710.1 aminopeptidase P family protein [Lachnospiraceae bacterium]MDY4618107.1 aminopeptidase P family protein [Lachnospiraceae bacterium]
MIQKRLEALRSEMKKRGITVYVVPTSDFHQSEYVGEYFKARKYMTGFTGSAGTAVITMKEAGLWTDGRYFIQAAAQLEGSGVTLFRMGEEGVPKVEEYVEEQLEKGGCIGFDGRVMDAKAGKKYAEIAEKKEGSLYVTEDLVDIIWTERPSLPAHKVWILEQEYAGMSTEEKLSQVREQMKQEGADVHILASLYDIAWLLNLRGDDIDHVPVFLSFVAVEEKKTTLFINQEILDDKVKKYLKDNQVQVEDYEKIYAYAENLKDHKVLMSLEEVNYRIAENVQKHSQIVDAPNPSLLLKSIKNEIELENTRIAHLKDAVAVTKFMYWLKTNIGKKEITEISASDYLEELRKEQEHFLDVSFDTICAYGANAAMMHYSASEESNAVLKPEGFLLVDSGGHYLEGTTDITRTFALGELSYEQKKHFTAVCRSNLNLANAKFLYGCSGINLDILARGPLWDMGIDYRCGTGHGVGHILNVHEGPNGFRWKVVQERNDSGKLEAGMITTDEPGVYLEGAYGIRLENELICVKDEKNEYGQFMKFENITYVPMDLDAILPEEMTFREKQELNEYHQMVYEKISPYLNEEERDWLKEYTRAI